MKIFIDGKYLDEADAKISVFDHGLLYGDGIFEGIRIYNGRVFLLDEHLDRLWDSAKAIMLKIPMSYEDLKAATLETCRLNELQDGYIRLVVTRGVGNLGINPEKCPKATVFIIAATISLYPEECYTKGLRVNTGATQRINVAAFSPAIKSLNYLNNILAKIEGNLYGAQETVMLNQDGYVAECTGDNIFVLKKGHIFTPPIYAGALGGLTRKVMFDLARTLGKDIVETNLTRYDLFVADEIFLTGSGAEVVPVYEVDGRTIGTGKPGPITLELMSLFKNLTRSSGVPIYTR
ncbi:MAG: branched-chain-amino-acid transaminase [Candidatus Methylacidiphilales bacterium]|nr:branched-chain-amino-acid transaminase [Candidatus Methylacidiphilales bacterium]